MTRGASLVVGALLVGACGGGSAATDSTETTTPSETVVTTMAAGTSTTSTTPTTAPPSTTVPDVPTSIAKPNPGTVMSVVTVTGTEIRLLESDPVQVRLIVDASLPTPCHAPVWTVDDDGSTISVLLQASIDADQICVDVIEEVELQIDLGSFPTGSSRSVELNGEMVGEFDL